jgi:hypothetical protein
MNSEGLFSRSSWEKAPVSEKKRILFWILILWLPPILSIILSRPLTEKVPQIDIFQDFSFHVRNLIAVPILLVCEKIIFRATNELISTGLQRGVIRKENKENIVKFQSHLHRFQSSIVIEVLLILLSLLYVTNHLYIDFKSEVTFWKSTNSPFYAFAFWWDQWVGLTAYFFLILRWIFKFILWISLLLKLSCSKLNLVCLHPDKIGGLSFLVQRHFLFAFVATAISSVGSANIASSVMYGNITLETFYLPLGLYVTLLVGVFVLPLIFFSPLLLREKKRGKNLYGNLAFKYTENFKKKWFNQNDLNEQELLGSPDIQSLNDLMGSFSQLGSMNVIPITRQTLIILISRIGIPILPLGLFKIPLPELFSLVIKHIL